MGKARGRTGAVRKSRGETGGSKWKKKRGDRNRATDRQRSRDRKAETEKQRRKGERQKAKGEGDKRDQGPGDGSLFGGREETQTSSARQEARKGNYSTGQKGKNDPNCGRPLQYL